MWSNRFVGILGLSLALVFSVPWSAPAAAQTPPSPQALPIEVTGVTFAEFDDVTGITRMDGSPLVATRGLTVIKALRARYDRRARTLAAEGGVEASEPGLTIRADAIEYRLDDESFHAGGNVRMTSVPQGQTSQATTILAPEVAGSLRTRRFVATGGVTIIRGEWTVTGRRGEFDDGTKVAVVTGDPEVRFGEGVMTADTLILFLDAERVQGEGSVQMRRGELTGRAHRVDVSMKAGLAVFSGSARVDRGSNRVTADVIETTLDGQRITAHGASRLVVASPPTPTATPPSR